MINPSFIPSQDIQQLRDLLRFRMKLTYQITGMKNRTLNYLTILNLKLDDVFSDVFGKSSHSIIRHILDHPSEHFYVALFIDKRCKHPIEEIQAAVDSAVNHKQATKLRICLDFIDEQQKCISELDAEIYRLVEPYAAVLDLMRTTPGLPKDLLIAICILSEIGADMSVFPTSKHLISWAGCCPHNDQSA